MIGNFNNYRILRQKNSKNSFWLQFITLFLVACLAFGNVVLAQDQASDEAETEKTAEEVEAEEAVEGAEAFLNLRNKLNEARDNLSQSVVDTSVLEDRLSEVSDEITTLEEQIQNIDDQLELTQKRIKVMTDDINDNEDEIDDLKKEIKLLADEIEKQKQNLASLIVMVYFENEQAGFFDSSDLQTIKLLMGDENVTDLLERSEGLTMLEFSLQDLLSELDKNKRKLDRDKEDLIEKTTELRALREDVKDQNIFLSLQKKSKEKILEQTKGEEAIYNELIRRAKDEQIQIRQDINQLVGVYAKYQERFGEDGFGVDQFGTTFDSDKLSWPVPPNLGISAFYRDASYKAALGVEHNAVDIRVAQGSQVRSVADGVVLKTKGGEGLDYHYIIIGHNNGLMTLYGHMYDIYVKEGDSVRRGDLIGLSGGMPGSRGAGWLTTGPHLHLEVFLNGVHVDPMLYMDLAAIDRKFIPEEYLK